jgi:hypothetical protein
VLERHGSIFIWQGKLVVCMRKTGRLGHSALTCISGSEGQLPSMHNFGSSEQASAWHSPARTKIASLCRGPSNPSRYDLPG